MRFPVQMVAAAHAGTLPERGGAATELATEFSPRSSTSVGDRNQNVETRPTYRQLRHGNTNALNALTVIVVEPGAVAVTLRD